MKRKFVIGNILRGWFQGEFTTIEHAEEELGKRFMISYPTDGMENSPPEPGARGVELFVKERNKYGFEQHLLCKSMDVPDFQGTSEERQRIIKECPRYTGFAIYPK